MQKQLKLFNVAAGAKKPPNLNFNTDGPLRKISKKLPDNVVSKKDLDNTIMYRTVRNVAEAVGVTCSTVRAAITRGELIATKLSAMGVNKYVYYVVEADFLAFLKQRKEKSKC